RRPVPRRSCEAKRRLRSRSGPWSMVAVSPIKTRGAPGMPRVQAGELNIAYVDRGTGSNVVLALHGNLGCADWLDLVLPLLPGNIRVIAAEWRGCGDSDKPDPLPDYSNYSMATHAGDMLALLDALS